MLDTDYLLSWRGVFAATATVAIVIVAKVLTNWIAALKYYKGRGIPGPTPWPMIGNFYQIISAGMMQNDIELKKKYGPIVGTFEGSKPVILINDLNFLKSVMIKDFHNFTNRRTFDGLVTKPIDKMLTMLKDDEWKNVRSIVSGAFSSGKLKLMTKCINTCVQNYMSFLDNLIEKHDGILEATTFSNYTLDVICACSFGIDTDTINNPETDLVRYLKKLANPNIKDPRLLLAFFAPGLAKFLVRHNLMNILNQEGLDYLERLMNQIIEMRTSGKEKRNDFIQMVLEYQKEEHDPETFTLKPLSREDENNSNKPRTKKVLTNTEILSQSILFVMAGYDTTASTLRFIAYNIATHAECQEKLIKEIDRVLEDFNGEVNYESVSKMNYMDMVIDETLRLYPAAARVDRIASNDFEYGNVKIKKDEVLCIPINTIHHDPEIFPNPEEFIPERFSEENNRKREGVAFLGFGAGPRNCVASRFAYLEMKLLIAAILSKYRLTKCDKTVEKMELDKAQARAAPKDPIVVKVVRR